MLAEIDVDGVVLGHSERRELLRRDRPALQLKVPAALEAGLTPILCVGETEEERERGDTERKLRHQVQEGLEKVAARAPAPRSSIAYEPIWAIGTGKVATPEQAQEAVAFVRALVEGFDKEAGQAVRDPLRRLAQARQRRRAARAARRRRRARRRRQSLDPDSFAQIVEIARGARDAVSTVPAVCLVILDGWGLAPDGPGNAVSLADTPVFDGLWERYDHTHADRVRRGRRAAAGPDGQLRGRPPQPRRRRDRPAGPRCASTRRSRTARWPRTR